MKKKKQKHLIGLLGKISSLVCFSEWYIGTVITIAIGGLSTDIKGLLKGLRNLEIRTQVETIQMAAQLRSVRILRIPETWAVKDYQLMPVLRTLKGVK